METLIRFDWATKYLLRDKANFGVLEGFLSELIGEDVKILELLESEANKDQGDNKLNCLDLLAKTEKGELVIFEVQNSTEMDYLQRVLFGTSKAVVDYIKKGEHYDKIKKIYSVSILYFNLGQGDDYIYKGETNFIGMHSNHVLQLSENQKLRFQKEKPADIFPTYFLIQTNRFNDEVKAPLDEWIYLFKNSEVKKGFHAKGIAEAAEKLRILNLKKNERYAYEHYMKAASIDASVIETRRFNDLMKEKRRTAEALISDGFSNEQVAKYTELPLWYIQKVRDKTIIPEE